MVVLHKPQQIQHNETVYCKHCAKVAEYHSECDGYYDKREWFTCDCQAAIDVDNIRTEVHNLAHRKCQAENELDAALEITSSKSKEKQLEIALELLRESTGASVEDMVNVLKRG